MTLDDLILLRLCAASAPTERGETRSRLAADLRPLWPAGTAGGSSGGGGAARWSDAFPAAAARLATAGCLVASGRGGSRWRLTEAGVRRAREAFGLPSVGTDVPDPGAAGGTPRRGWAHWRDAYALPRALDTRQRAAGADDLRAALLRKLFLPDARGAGGLRAAVDQLLAKTLKTPRATVPEFRLAALRAAVAEAGAPLALTPPPASGRRLPEDLSAFAALVRETARRCETGRFGEHKVFIAHVWRALVAAGRAAPEEAAAFKERLARASAADLLRLARADLTGAFDPADMADSETSYLHERFHFIRLD